MSAVPYVGGGGAETVFLIYYLCYFALSPPPSREKCLATALIVGIPNSYIFYAMMHTRIPTFQSEKRFTSLLARFAMDQSLECSSQVFVARCDTLLPSCQMIAFKCCAPERRPLQSHTSPNSTECLLNSVYFHLFFTYYSVLKWFKFSIL